MDLAKGKLTLADNIYNQLLTQISKGIYPTGEKLPSEQELCKLYGVSRISVRSALQRLEATGIIETFHGKGSYVKGVKSTVDYPKLNIAEITSDQILTDQDYEEFWQFRHAVEAQAYPLFAIRATAEDYAALDECIRKMIDSSTPRELADATFDYHNYIYLNCGNRYLAYAMAPYETVFRAAIFTIQTIRKQTRGMLAQWHIAMNGYLRNRDATSVLNIIVEENVLLLKQDFHKQ